MKVSNESVPLDPISVNNQIVYDQEVAESIGEERNRLITLNAIDSQNFRVGMCRAITVIFFCSVVVTGTGTAYALTGDRVCRAISITAGIYGASVLLIAIGETIAQCRRRKAAFQTGL